MPCAPMMIAVLMPMTSPREDTSGPPELPGLSAASVWMTSSISRPLRARSERPSAETTPAVTVDSKPSGLPMAMTSWPRLSVLESPSGAAGSATSSSTRTSARSVSGSSPTTRAFRLRPSGVVTPSAVAPPTTWRIGQDKAVGRREQRPSPSRRGADLCRRRAARPPPVRAVRRRRPRRANRHRAASCVGWRGIMSGVVSVRSRRTWDVPCLPALGMARYQIWETALAARP